MSLGTCPSGVCINSQNADALSRLVSDCSNHFNAAVQIAAPTISNQELQSAQTADPVISKVISPLLEGAEPQGNEWKRFPLRRFAQLSHGYNCRMGYSS
ncbi:hypothetical protein M514_28256 [Trichuris suis]|uniref:Uncharacterized protein n=1 Tax=Trichuris suis TaxID=68888 RepID=A0A085MQR9_9BILA|nr:hypothetical protein M514_28256 [Trichuris suis]